MTSPRDEIDSLLARALVVGVLWLWGIGSITCLLLATAARQWADESGIPVDRPLLWACRIIGWIGLALAITLSLLASR